ncbi:MAG: hypothetical protein LBI49_18805 [Nocardiopsaceae bacterium]|nr:hypothetical protein [Nocardiopsaceae bacterium]
MTAHAAHAAHAASLAPAGGLVLLVAAAVLGVPGWLAYTGRWRRWTAGPYGSAFPYFPFGLAWMCAGGMLLGLFWLISAAGSAAAGISAVVLGLPGLVMFGCGLVFLLRTPQRFLPAWYRKSRPHPRAPR